MLIKGRTAGAAAPCTPAHDGAVCWARGMFYVIHCDATRGRGIRHHQTSSGSICQPGPCLHAAAAAPCPSVCQSAALFLLCSCVAICHTPPTSYIVCQHSLFHFHTAPIYKTNQAMWHVASKFVKKCLHSQGKTMQTENDMYD